MPIRVFLVLSLLVCAPSHASENSGATFRRCAFGLALAAGIGARFATDALSRSRGFSVDERHWIEEVIGHTTGPFWIATGLLNEIDRENAVIGPALKTFRLELGFLVGYLALIGLIREIPSDLGIHFPEFEKAGEPYLDPSPPENVLYLMSLRDSDNVRGFYPWYFENRYRDRPAPRVYEFEGPRGLIGTLKALERKVQKGKIPPFDRVEFLIHGHPNRLIFAEGSAGPQILESWLGGRRFDITRAGAELRLISCSVGRPRLFGRAEPSLVRMLGEAVLPRGGLALASSRILSIPSNQVDLPRPRPANPTPGFLVQASGLGVWVELQKQIAKLSRTWPVPASPIVVEEIKPGRKLPKIPYVPRGTHR